LKLQIIICSFISQIYCFLQVAKEELSRECDYELEAENQIRFRNLLSDKEGFYVPLVVEELSSKKVLTTELISGNSFVLFDVFLLFVFCESLFYSF